MVRTVNFCRYWGISYKKKLIYAYWPKKSIILLITLSRYDHKTMAIMTSFWEIAVKLDSGSRNTYTNNRFKV